MVELIAQANEAAIVIQRAQRCRVERRSHAGAPHSPAARESLRVARGRELWGDAPSLDANEDTFGTNLFQALDGEHATRGTLNADTRPRKFCSIESTLNAALITWLKRDRVNKDIKPQCVFECLDDRYP